MSSALPAPAPGIIAIGSLSQASRQKRRFDAILSIEDPKAKPTYRFRFNQSPYRPQLVLRFEDVDDVSFGYAHANAAQVETALEFGRHHADQSLLVHCHHGIGRSAATALAIMTDRAGPGSEVACVEALFAQRPEACPNIIVVALADGVLGRNSALIDALVFYEATHPHMATRRANRRYFAENNGSEFAPAAWDGLRELRLHGA